MRLDKTAFKKHSPAEAADHQRHYRRMSGEERAQSFRYLMSVAYGFLGREWPRMDKSCVHIRKRP